jgi:hypothetical protein
VVSPTSNSGIAPLWCKLEIFEQWHPPLWCKLDIKDLHLICRYYIGRVRQNVGI